MFLFLDLTYFLDPEAAHDLAIKSLKLIFPKNIFSVEKEEI